MVEGHLNEVERVKAALACIPPDIKRDDWLRVGTALKRELGEDSLELFESWNSACKEFLTADVRSTWLSMKAGTVNRGTNTHIGRQYGLDAAASRPAPDRTASERNAAKLARHNAQAIAKRARKVDRAADTASPARDDHPYLQRNDPAAMDILREIDAEALPDHIGYAPRSFGKSLLGRILILPVKISCIHSTAEVVDSYGRKTTLKVDERVALPDFVDVLWSFAAHVRDLKTLGRVIQSKQIKRPRGHGSISRHFLSAGIIAAARAVRRGTL